MPDTNLPSDPPHNTGVDWNWWTELAAAVLLGLAAVATGWTAYQSTLWSGKSVFALNDASGAARRATALEVESLQYRALDVGVFLQYLDALSRGDQRLAEFIYRRSRPEMKTAIVAWLATRPLTNPNAPQTPFAMKEYHLPAQDEAERLNAAYYDRLHEADLASGHSSRYVLMTVPFAIVSLFSGLSTRFASPAVKMAIVGLALAVFISAAVVLASLPHV